MTQITFGQVEDWLDAHPDLCQDYFLRKAELAAINAWLVNHGFLTIDDYVTCSSRRGSNSSVGGGSGSGSPCGDEQSLGMTLAAPHNSNSAAATNMNGNHRRANSKRCLRHDFARCKSRSVFRTHEVAGACANKEPGGPSSRRSSLKDMRKFVPFDITKLKWFRHLTRVDEETNL